MKKTICKDIQVTIRRKREVKDMWHIIQQQQHIRQWSRVTIFIGTYGDPQLQGKVFENSLWNK